MEKMGIVTQINRNYACILTASGEFAKVKYTKAPSIGQEYKGVLYSGHRLKMPLIAASLTLFLLSGGLLSYFTPAYAVTVEINPSVKLKVNMWNRIIKAEPINEDGKKLLGEISVNNMPLEGALETIVDEAKKDNYIDDNYTSEGKAVKVTFEGKKEVPSDIKNFTDSLKEKKINVQIIKDGSIVKPEDNSKINNDKGDEKKSDDTKNPKDDKNNNKGNTSNNQDSKDPQKNKDTTTNEKNLKSDKESSSTKGSVPVDAGTKHSTGEVNLNDRSKKYNANLHKKN